MIKNDLVKEKGATDRKKGGDETPLSRKSEDSILKYTFIQSHKALKYVVASIFLVALLSASVVLMFNYETNLGKSNNKY